MTEETQEKKKGFFGEDTAEDFFGESKREEVNLCKEDEKEEKETEEKEEQEEKETDEEGKEESFF